MNWGKSLLNYIEGWLTLRNFKDRISIQPLLSRLFLIIHPVFIFSSYQKLQLNFQLSTTHSLISPQEFQRVFYLISETFWKQQEKEKVFSTFALWAWTNWRFRLFFALSAFSFDLESLDTILSTTHLGRVTTCFTTRPTSRTTFPKNPQPRRTRRTSTLRLFLPKWHLVNNKVILQVSKNIYPKDRKKRKETCIPLY